MNKNNIIKQYQNEIENYNNKLLLINQLPQSEKKY